MLQGADAELGAVAAGRYGQDWLTHKAGLSTRLINDIRSAAALSPAADATPLRHAAAQQLRTGLPALRKSRDATLAAASWAIGWGNSR